MARNVPRFTPMKRYGRIPGVLVQFPYDEHLIAQLKAMVPRADRWYNEHRKGWWIAEPHRKLVEHLIREAFPKAVEIVDEEGRAVTIEGDDRLVQERLL